MVGMKNMQLLVLLVIGAVLTVLGALLKIMHWPLGSLLLIVGMTFEAVSGALLVWKSFKGNKNNDSFLDS